MPLTDRDKRTLRIGGIVLGVLVVGFLLMNLLGGGGEEATTSSPPLRPPPSSTGGGGESETPSLAPSPVLVLPVRDPFSIPPGFPVGSSGSTSSSSGTDTGSTSTSTTTGTSSSTATSPGGTGTSTSASSRGPSGSSATTTIGGHQVTLLDTSSNGVEQATVEVDSTVYHPTVGERFGPNRQYMLQSVSGNCATFLFGDEAFTLCVPQNK